MKTLVGVLFLLLAGIAAIAWFLILPDFFSARHAPAAVEEAIVRRVRRLAIPEAERERVNPLSSSPELLSEARRHFADHCAFCHGTDGRGNRDLGATFYPRVPDLRDPVIQALSDGEMHYAIQSGIRFSGMPAWGSDGEHARSSWALVHWIRRLAELSDADLRPMDEPNDGSSSAGFDKGSGDADEAHGHSHRH